LKCINCGHKNPAGLDFCEKCTVQLNNKGNRSKQNHSVKKLKRTKRPKTSKHNHSDYPYQPPYPYPYPPHVFPSLYGDIYEKPPGQSRLRFDIIPKIFIKPKNAFKEIYPHTSTSQGLILVFIFTLILILIRIAFYSSYRIIVGSYGSITIFLTEDRLFFIIMVKIPVALITVSLIGFISAYILRDMDGGKGNVDKTIGLLGYANVISVVWSIITMAIIHIILIMESSNNYFALPKGFRIMLGILALIGFIWSLIVNSYAVAIANNVSLGRGMIIYFTLTLMIGFLLLMIP
jgi:hypothetical protein